MPESLETQNPFGLTDAIPAAGAAGLAVSMLCQDTDCDAERTIAYATRVDVSKVIPVTELLAYRGTPCIVKLLTCVATIPNKGAPVNGCGVGIPLEPSRSDGSHAILLTLTLKI